MEEFALPTSGFSEPTGTESVRTTFKLSKNSREALDWLTNTRYNITQKEFFDRLVDSDSDELVQDIVKYLKQSDWQIGKDPKRVTKVVSKRMLKKLDNLVDENNLSRDAIVEVYILLHKKISERTIASHKIILSLLNDLSEQMSKYHSEISEKLVSHDDPVLSRLSNAEEVICELIRDIEDEIKDGTPIDPYKFFG